VQRTLDDLRRAARIGFTDRGPVARRAQPAGEVLPGRG